MTSTRKTGSDGRRDEWPRISNHIVRGLARDADSWFDHVVREVRSVSSGPEPNAPKAEPKRTALGGEAVHAVRAFQLIAATRFIDTLRYIPEADARDFADLLWAQVCGSKLDEVINYVRYYREVEGDQEAEWSRFAADIMTYVLGETSPLFLIMSVIMQTTFPELIGHVGSIVADAFGDENTFNDLQRQLKDMRARQT
jgi:hypothetical protein